MTQHRPGEGGDRKSVDTAYTLHAVVFPHGEWLIAQCLEHDIVTQARSYAELYHEVSRVLVAHLMRASEDKATPFADIPKAPRKFWEMWKSAPFTLNPRHELSLGAAGAPRLELRAA